MLYTASRKHMYKVSNRSYMHTHYDVSIHMVIGSVHDYRCKSMQPYVGCMITDANLCVWHTVHCRIVEETVYAESFVDRDTA